eukprot:2679773-Amphidinium_carterae.3
MRERIQSDIALEKSKLSRLREQQSMECSREVGPGMNRMMFSTCVLDSDGRETLQKLHESALYTGTNVEHRRTQDEHIVQKES